MKKLKNPFTKIEGYNCFGCAKNNDYGLRMEFFEEGDEIISLWEPSHHFQGYNNILHGGIQAALLDEIAAWVIFVKLKTIGLTIAMDVRLNKPVYVDKGIITLKAKLNEFKRKIARVEAFLINHENTVAAEALMTYYVNPSKNDNDFSKIDFNFYE